MGIPDYFLAYSVMTANLFLLCAFKEYPLRSIEKIFKGAEAYWQMAAFFSGQNFSVHSASVRSGPW